MNTTQTTSHLPAVQQRGIATAVTQVFNDAADCNAQITGMRIAEHADGSGRWHVLADCIKQDGDEGMFRIIVKIDGGVRYTELLPAN